MAMTIQALGDGNFRVTQKLQPPVVYLDHWAVRLFSENLPLQDRFVSALHGSEGTWLFSTANLFEFVAMTDLTQAVAAEKLLLRAMPSLHVVDVAGDKGYLLPEGAASHPDAPEEDWLLKDLGARAYIAGGAWNTHRFVQDAIAHRDQLLPLFDAMKADISKAVMALTLDKEKNANARKFVPKAGMSLRDALAQELMREPHVNPAYSFDNNDAMDLIHAIPAAVVSDFVLLDSRWCHRLESAARRIRRGGVTGELARCFSPKTVADFLSALEAMLTSRPGTSFKDIQGLLRRSS